MSAMEELGALVLRHAPAEGSATRLPGVRMMASGTPTEQVSAIYEPAVALVVQGRKQTLLGDAALSYGAGEYLIVPVEVPVSGQVTEASEPEPFLAIGLELKPALIANVLLDESATGAPADAPLLQGPTVAKADDRLIEAFSRLVRLLDTPEEAAFLRPLIEREIIWRLLAGEHGQTVRQIGLADSRLSQIRRAIRRIRTDYDKPLRMENLARDAGMSVTSFHRHFRAVTNTSPLQYQKHIRLHEARTRLMSGNRSVASIGFEVGYDSPSQFSREYGRLFGTPPGKDSAQLRSLAQTG